MIIHELFFIIIVLEWKMLHDKWDSKEIDNLNEMK